MSADAPRDLAARVVELETRVAFQEHALQQLNEALLHQQQMLNRLTNDLAALTERLRGLDPLPSASARTNPAAALLTGCRRQPSAKSSPRGVSGMGLIERNDTRPAIMNRTLRFFRRHDGDDVDTLFLAARGD